MSPGIFLDYVAISARADFGTLVGEVSHLLAPVTPDFIFEHRRIKKAEALSKLSAIEEEYKNYMECRMQKDKEAEVDHK